MKKALLISNLARKFTNFIVPSIEVLQDLGYEVHTCANYSNFNDDKSKYSVTMHHIDFERSPFNFKNIKAYKQLMKLMEQEKFDLIHCNTPIGGILGRICARKNKVKTVIYTAHGFHFYKGAPVINNILYKNVEKFLARYTDILITINKEDFEATKKFKLRKGGQVYKVNGVGIDTNIITTEKFDKLKYRKTIGLSKENIILIAVGELNKNKNYETIIKAISSVNNLNVHLLICGIGKEEENLKKLAKKLKLENNIHFLGFRNDVQKLLLISDVFLQASYREGLPRAIMEAMTVGLPCIVSDIRGNRDLIKNERGGFLNNPNSSEDFAKSISELVKDKDLRVKMGEFNKEHVKQFDTENVRKELYEIYSNIKSKEE